MSVQQLERDKSFDGQPGFSCPACCFEGCDRWRQTFYTPLCRSQEGFRIIAKLVFPFCAQPVLCSERQITLSDRHKQMSWEVHVNTMTLRPPCNSPQRTMNEVFIKMAASSIDIPASCRAIPQCNLFPHALAPFFANNYLLYWGLHACQFKYLSPWIQKRKKKTTTLCWKQQNQGKRMPPTWWGRWTFWGICSLLNLLAACTAVTLCRQSCQVFYAPQWLPTNKEQIFS